MGKKKRQVYSSWTRITSAPIVATSTVSFGAAATKYVVSWTADGGEPLQVTLLTDAAAIKVNNLPVGTKVQLAEAADADDTDADDTEPETAPASQDVKDNAAAAPTGCLPDAGSSASDFILPGALLSVIGSALIMLARRRKVLH